MKKYLVSHDITVIICYTHFSMNINSSEKIKTHLITLKLSFSSLLRNFHPTKLPPQKPTNFPKHSCKHKNFVVSFSYIFYS